MIPVPHLIHEHRPLGCLYQVGELSDFKEASFRSRKNKRTKEKRLVTRGKITEIFFLLTNQVFIEKTQETTIAAHYIEDPRDKA